MTRAASLPDLIVRPPSVWDTRSPTSYFLRIHKLENRLYYTLLLGVQKLLRDLRAATETTPAWEFFGVDEADRVYKSLWRSFPTISERIYRKPLASDLPPLLTNGIPAITEYAITSYCGQFEHFMQSWAINVLLARLENGEGWQSCEAKFAQRYFSPSGGKLLPGLPDIVKAVPTVKGELLNTPHVLKDPRTGKDVMEPLTANLNAFKVISLWRDWRNLLVHESGVISEHFHHTYGLVWTDFRNVFPHIPELRPGHRLHLNEATFKAFATAHHVAALRLRKILVAISREKRGHMMAPGPDTYKGKVPVELVPETLPHLLMSCDHQPSYRYSVDDTYRATMLKLSSRL